MVSYTVGYMGHPVPRYLMAKDGVSIFGVARCVKIVRLMRSTRDNVKNFNIGLNSVTADMTRMSRGDRIPDRWDDLERRGIPVQEPIWVARGVGGTLIVDEK